ncbi:MAG TPA: hypothetical protein DCY85_07770 [Firmicutes bacterium]|nr:hypothetical protein [Bacillota bacterium]
MKLLKALRAEILKMSRDKIFWLSVAGLLGSTLMVLVMFVFGKDDLIRRDLWNLDWFVDQSLQWEALLLGPMMVAIIGAYLVTLEYRQKTMKSLLPLPMSNSAIFAGKNIWGMVALAIGMLAAWIITILVPMALGLDPAAGSSLTDVIRHTAISQAALLAAFWPCLAFALTVSLISKNFVVPLAAAMVVQIGGLLALQGDKGHLAWPAIPLMIYNTVRKGGSFEPLLNSALFAVGFIVIGILWAALTKKPE